MLSIDAGAGLLVNDLDKDGDALTVTGLVAGEPANGSLQMQPDGSFLYKPIGAFNGEDSFTYRATDGFDTSNLATVRITVTAVNRPPVAAADAYNTPAGGTLAVSPSAGTLHNDFDPDGDKLRAVLVSGPAHGTLSMKLNGSFVYTPATGFSGSDSFIYRVTDGAANSPDQTVSLSVVNLNRSPTAAADSYSVIQDTVLVTTVGNGLLANDSDPDGNLLQALLVSQPGNGSLGLKLDGSFSYTPDAGYSGPDQFSYQVSDGLELSGVVQVSLNVVPVAAAQPPVAVADSYEVFRETTLVANASTGVLANDVELNGGSLSAIAFSTPTHGTLQASLDGGFTYRPNTGFVGQDSFTYEATDGLNSAPATVTINVRGSNSPPLPGSPTFIVFASAAFQSGLPGALKGSVDPDGDQLTAYLDTGPTKGVVQLNLDGSFTYTPKGNLNDTDSFVVEISDGIETALVNVSLIIQPAAAGVTKGIPILNQVGLAMLALLMLGMSLVSLRRFS